MCHLPATKFRFRFRNLSMGIFVDFCQRRRSYLDQENEIQTRSDTVFVGPIRVVGECNRNVGYIGSEARAS